MTQEQLSQVFEDISIHGRRVEGWSYENQAGEEVLTDLKRGGIWRRASPQEPWRSAT